MDIETVEVRIPKAIDSIEFNQGIKGDRGVSITDFTLDDDGNAVTTFENGETKKSKLTSIASASASAKKAAISEANAKGSADKALTSETNAKTSETNAATSAENAKASEVAAKLSETNAKDSETAAKSSEEVSSTKAGEAAASATSASASAVMALASEAKSAKSAESAEDSYNKTVSIQSDLQTTLDTAKASETAAKASEVNAKASETASADSASKAHTSELNAKASETSAATSASTATTQASNASSSATTAKNWAVATTSPDGATDADSDTGKTQSSRSWALMAKASAESASSSASTAASQASAATASAIGKHLFPLHNTTQIVGNIFGTGGNMNPNNRINSKRIHVVKNTKVHLMPNTEEYAFYTVAYKPGTNTVILRDEIGGHDWDTVDAVFNASCDLVVVMNKKGDKSFTSVDEMNGVFSIIEPVNEAVNEAVNETVNEAVNFRADILEKISAYFPLSLRRFGTGGNMTPNNRIHINRFKVTAGDFIYLSPKASNYAFAFTLYDENGTIIMSSSAVEGSRPGGWLHTPYVFEKDCYCYLEISHGAKEGDYIHNNAVFESLTDIDGNIFFIQKQKLDNEEERKRELVNSEVLKTVEDAQYALASTIKPLTLLHFSDIHGDADALTRILKDASAFKYDDAICTGDMAANTIDNNFTDWWNPKVLTCIGNHDCATIAQIDEKWVYTWDALSMADRDKTYIKPFEANWGITHTEGTSYYYKDYTDKHVRLIVLDNHLDNYESTKAEAAAQNAWLTSVLESARLAGLHVLIATHYVIPNSKIRDCTFSQFGQTEIGSLVGGAHIYENTVNAVSDAIARGLHFIGYISGHTHRDNIFDAFGDGKQMQYNITCAAVSYAPQWNTEDLFRDETRDAFNMVVIDTEHTLVKLIRGGGADLDRFMRPRKAICIDYSTGKICGEIK